MKASYILACLSFVFVMTTGCIRENLDHCDNVTICFQYMADGDEDVLYQYVDKVDLYVFDENEKVLDHKTYYKEDLKDFSVAPTFRLEYGGHYNIVALGNAYSHTEVVDLASPDLDKIYIQNINWGKSPMEVNTYDHNYLGGKAFVMPDIEGMMHCDTVMLKSSHINVDIRIFGGEAQAEGDQLPYELRIEQSNAQVTFKNLINTEEKGTCYPDLVYDSENQCYRTVDLVLFRFDNSGVMTESTCSHTLVLTNTLTGKELLRYPVSDYLAEYPDMKDEVLKQEADLAMKLVINNTKVEIQVPDWEIEEVTPEW